ncbi:hypothetical protein GK011_12745 [Erwinia sp. J316]|uniref:Transposase n=1 Tax=Erwinia sorbitola TaxID=2681984 RepID=A0ABW9RCT1_9GAMM|nr:hypothetical protein [Erwinia sorbitola]
MSNATFFACCKKYAGMEEPEVKHLKSLEDDNARFKKLPAEAMLDNEALQMALAKSINGRSEAGNRGVDM